MRFQAPAAIQSPPPLVPAALLSAAATARAIAIDAVTGTKVWEAARRRRGIGHRQWCCKTKPCFSARADGDMYAVQVGNRATGQNGRTRAWGAEIYSTGTVAGKKRVYVGFGDGNILTPLDRANGPRFFGKTAREWIVARRLVGHNETLLIGSQKISSFMRH